MAIAVASDDRHYAYREIVDLETESVQAVVKRIANPPATFSPDGQYLAVAELDGTVVVYDLRS
ncbi:MAG: hypothetical protein R3E01_27170 [Pirellulaceae bacterium]|nr:hypothetical protein [Planctomycetales bacterium]